MKKAPQTPDALSPDLPPRRTGTDGSLPENAPPGPFSRALAIIRLAAAALWLAALALVPASEREALAALGFFAMTGLCLFACASLRAMIPLCVLAFMVLAALGPATQAARPEGPAEWAALLAASALTGCVLAYGLFSVRRFFAAVLAGVGEGASAWAGRLRRGTALAAGDRTPVLPALVGLATGACVGLFPEALIRGHETAGAVLACAPVLPFVLYGRAFPVTFFLRAANYLVFSLLIRLAVAYLPPFPGHGVLIGLAYGLSCYRPILGPAMTRRKNLQPAPVKS